MPMMSDKQKKMGKTGVNFPSLAVPLLCESREGVERGEQYDLRFGILK